MMDTCFIFLLFLERDNKGSEFIAVTILGGKNHSSFNLFIEFAFLVSGAGCKQINLRQVTMNANSVMEMGQPNR